MYLTFSGACLSFGVGPMKYVVTIILLFQAHCILGDTAVVATIEWLSDHMKYSGLYEVSKVIPKEGNERYICHFKLKEKHRGDIPEIIVDDYYLSLRKPPQKLPIVEEGDTFLLFWGSHYGNSTKPVIEQIINLTNPARGWWRQIAVNNDLKLLTEGKEILKLYKNRLRINPKVVPLEYNIIDGKSKVVELRGDIKDFDVWAAVHSGSGTYAILPKE